MVCNQEKNIIKHIEEGFALKDIFDTLYGSSKSKKKDANTFVKNAILSNKEEIKFSYLKSDIVDLIKSENLKFGIVREPYYDVGIKGMIGGGSISSISSYTKTTPEKWSFSKDSVAGIISQHIPGYNKAKAKKIPIEEMLNLLCKLDPKAKILKDELEVSSSTYLKKGTKKNGDYATFKNSIGEVNQYIVKKAIAASQKYNDVFKKDDKDDLLNALYRYNQAEVLNKDLFKILDGIVCKYNSYIYMQLEKKQIETKLFSLVDKVSLEFNQSALSLYAKEGKYGKDIITFSSERKTDIVKITNFGIEDFTDGYSHELDFFLSEKADYKRKKEIEKDEKDEEEEIFLFDLEKGIEDEEILLDRENGQIKWS